METVIAAIGSALITGAVTLIVSLVSNNANQKKTEALINYRIGELEKRVDKHNNLIERTYNLENRISINEEKIHNLEKGA